MSVTTTSDDRAVSTAGVDPQPGELMSVLEALASELVPVGPNMSNQSTPPQNTDFDDQ